MITTSLKNTDILPLTCSRKGTCCHGNLVFLNPWELAQLSKEKNITPKEFQIQFTTSHGIQLKFEGEKDSRNKAACNLYIDDFGCSVHQSRPLACRLFPIGRQIQNDKVEYIFQGKEFPCLSECKEVLNLPKLKVEDYLKDQATQLFEEAQDAYLEIMQNIADISFSLLLDTKLAVSGNTNTLRSWREMGFENPKDISKRIDLKWLELLMTPPIIASNPIQFTQLHFELLQAKAQEIIDKLTTLEEIQNASILMMAIALFLAKGIGANPKDLSEFWIEIAKENGANE